MRLALLAAAALLTLTACSDESPAANPAPMTTQPAATTPVVTEVTSAPAPMGDGPQPFGVEGMIGQIKVTVSKPVIVPFPKNFAFQSQPGDRMARIDLTFVNEGTMIGEFGLSGTAGNRTAFAFADYEGEEGGPKDQLFARETSKRTRWLQIPAAASDLVVTIQMSSAGDVASLGELMYRETI